MNKLYIDGTNITSDITGLDSFILSIQKDSKTKTITKSLSSDVVVTGEAFKLLESIFFTNCDYSKKLNARFNTDLCGGLNIDLFITTELLIYDPCNCEITISLKSVSDELECFNYLDSHTWWQGLCDDYDYIYVWFADQPSWLLYIIFLLRQLIVFILVPITLILETVQAIINFLGSLFGGSLNVDLNPIDNLLARLDIWLTGSGRWTPTILVKDILEYQAAQCGYTLQSSIFQNSTSHYSRETIFCLDKGRFGSYDDLSNTTAREIFKENAPIETTIELLEKLKPKYNLDYCIKDKKLIVEPYDYFRNLNYPRISDVQTQCKELDQKLKYEYSLDNACAFGRFTYAQDSNDQEGNKILYRYEDIVEYNNPPNETQKGACDVTVNFGAARFMFDEIGRKRNSYFDFEGLVDEFRDGTDSLLSDFFGFSNQGLIRTNDLILSNSQTSLCKLLILEEGFDRKDAKIIRKSIGNTKYSYYNYPNYFDENLPNEIGETELINEFHKGRDPRTRKDIINLNQFEQKCNCDEVETVLANGTDVTLTTHLGVGIPTIIDIEFDKKQVTIVSKDITVFCN